MAKKNPTSTSPPQAIQPITITSTQAATLLINGSGLNRQPSTNQVLLNLDTIVYTNPETQAITTTIAGTTVTLHATPTSYTWTWGDGTTTTTTDPGHPWPDHTLAHRYTTTSPSSTITLTTTWKATYTPQDQPTQDVTGTITTTQASTPFAIARTTSYNTDQAETAQHH